MTAYHIEAENSSYLTINITGINDTLCHLQKLREQVTPSTTVYTRIHKYHRYYFFRKSIGFLLLGRLTPTLHFRVMQEGITGVAGRLSRMYFVYDEWTTTAMQYQLVSFIHRSAESRLFYFNCMLPLTLYLIETHFDAFANRADPDQAALV